jgi:arylsulfatase A-like enzyme
MTDLYPTLLDVAGLEMRSDQHINGTSLAPVLKDSSASEREALF